MSLASILFWLNIFTAAATSLQSCRTLCDPTREVRSPCAWRGPDLIDRVPDKLLNEVCDIVQETGIKTITMEKKCKKAKWLFGEALQIAVKRREVKSNPSNSPEGVRRAA